MNEWGQDCGSSQILIYTKHCVSMNTPPILIWLFVLLAPRSTDNKNIASCYYVESPEHDIGMKVKMTDKEMRPSPVILSFHHNLFLSQTGEVPGHSHPPVQHLLNLDPDQPLSQRQQRCWWRQGIASSASADTCQQGPERKPIS